MAAAITCAWVWLDSLVRPRLALVQASLACAFMLLVGADNVSIIEALAS